ncbi:heterokaryon incompatibility protein-domain-containing protein [Paraphoma chrysanthemicola]|nr:heterokaryon incompatibility protein-domain-containing protein [Paraphoma chrysanthemicola]
MQIPYRHIPLKGSRSIRVLELQPAPNISAPIFCQLKAVSLDDYPQWDANYTALSYTWGGQRPSCEIECDSCVMSITPNCDAAIRNLRSGTEVQVLWIDSICIDQSEEAVIERNRQVALMGEIYKSAAKVVIWLGQSNERVEAAMRQVMEIAHIAQTAKLRDGRAINQANRKAAQDALRDRVKRISSSATHASDDPFGPLFECSWFHRVWTVQECTLPFYQRVSLRCGILEMHWAALTLVANILDDVGYKWGRWREATILQNQFVIYLMIQRIKGAREVMNQNPGRLQNDPLMFSILGSVRMKQVTDPKDKIIGMYGLLKELHIPFPSPDYSLSVEELFREATVASINYDKKIQLLYQAPSDRRREGLASWVPDWAESGFQPDDMRHAVLEDQFAASGPGNPIWSFSHDHTALILRGKIVDTVIYKSEALSDTRNVALARRSIPLDLEGGAEIIRLNHAVSITMRSWVEVSQRCSYPTGEPSKEALQRTLVYDQPDNNADAIKDSAFNDWYDNMCLEEMNQVGRRSHSTALSGTRVITSDMTLTWRLFGRNHFHSLAHLFSSKKCFFSTGNDYFGTAPDPLPVCMMPGDEIAIISGLEMPLLLRPIGDGYRLITHVYVHGMMYGEMWPKVKDCLEDIMLL